MDRSTKILDSLFVLFEAITLELDSSGAELKSLGENGTVAFSEIPFLEGPDWKVLQIF